MILMSVEDIRDEVKIAPEKCAATRKRPSASNFSRILKDEDKGSPGFNTINSERNGAGMSIWESG